MMKRMTAAMARRAIQAGPEEGEQTAAQIMQSDVRVVQMERLVEVDEQLLGVVHDIFDGTGLVNNHETVSHLLTARAEILEHWSKSRASFLAIGRALLAVERTLTDEQFRRLRASSERLFPFSETVSSMLRQNARMIEDRRISEDELPASYATAYQISRMTVTELSEARRRGLIHPGVQRPAIISFRRQFRDPRPNTATDPLGSGRIDLTKLRSEMGALIEQRRAMLLNMVSLRERINTIRQLLSEEAHQG